MMVMPDLVARHTSEDASHPIRTHPVQRVDFPVIEPLDPIPGVDVIPGTGFVRDDDRAVSDLPRDRST